MRSASLTPRISDLLTAEQAASTLGISVATLWRWRTQGILEGRRVLGRTVFARNEVDALLKRRMAAG